MTAFWDLFTWLRGTAPRPERGAELVKCRSCRGEAVIPVDWEDGGHEWRISVRCGNCGERRDVTLDDDEARDYDRALDRGVYRIKRTITTLERRRMRAEAEALSIALERDLVDADDFARRPVAR